MKQLIGFFATVIMLVLAACSDLQFKNSNTDQRDELATAAFINGYYRGSIAQMKAKDNADFQRMLFIDSTNFRNLLNNK